MSKEKWSCNCGDYVNEYYRSGICGKCNAINDQIIITINQPETEIQEDINKLNEERLADCEKELKQLEKDLLIPSRVCQIQKNLCKGESLSEALKVSI